MTDFFNSVGMEYVVIGLAAALLLALILVIVALVKVGKLKKRYEKFLSGKDGKSLEESIVKRFDKLNEIIVEQDFLEQEIQRIDEEHKSSFSKMEVYKYNAFSDMGGETSFVIALLDHNNNGTLLNGMSSQNATYVYAKEIRNGASKVKPGLTGLAQVSGRDELEIDIKAALDGQYVKNITFIGDLKLFFKTFGSRASPVMI